MTFSHLNRRVHLYAGLALLPWFFMYGISSVPFAHNEFLQRRDAAKGLPPFCSPSGSDGLLRGPGSRSA